MSKVLVVAPHPDDETLGCGGTILKHKAQGDEVYWLIVTEMNSKGGYSDKEISERNKQIENVSKAYKFNEVFRLGFESSYLDTLPMAEIIKEFSKVLKKLQPEILYIPFKNDVHSDHEVVFNSIIAASKTFRNKKIKSLYVYETISETDFGSVKSFSDTFTPNVFIDISKFLKKKISIMKIYKSEIKKFPFPRSEKSINALAILRGAQSGTLAAESFMLLKEIK
tara:strand:- start:3301 stop:3972 length:672 start_codon:yes stop_codon:yes gene_type:complete